MAATQTSEDTKSKVGVAFKKKEKMARKRKKSEDENDIKIQHMESAKKLKQDLFTEIEFKVMLRDQNELSAGFSKFIEEAEKWPEKVEYDVVLEFIKSSPELTEIFTVLEAGKRKVPELTLIFQCLEKCLLRLMDMENYVTTGQTIVNKFLNSHLHLVYFTLNNQHKSKQIKSSLKLLTTMVMLSPASAKSVLTQLNLRNKGFQPLFSRRNTKDEEDVRTCLLRLIIAFLLSGDNTVIKQLLENKNFLFQIFPGLLYDRVETVELVLSVLLDKVVKNPGIGKTAKVRLFPENVLKYLVQLYKWRGIAVWKQQGKRDKPVQIQAEDTTEPVGGGRLVVSEAVHQFLLVLCASFKYGINFYDKYYGTETRNQNHIMSSFLTYLGGMSQNKYVRELIAKILCACPDQLKHFLPNLLKSLVPRASENWISNMTFLNQIYEELPMEPPVFHAKDKLSSLQLVNVLMTFTMPSRQILNTILPNPGGKAQPLVVWHKVLEMVKLLAHKASHILSLLSKPVAACQKFMHRYTPEELTDIIDSYRDSVLKKLPDPVEIFRCLDRLQQQTTSQSGQQEIKDLYALCNTGPQHHLVVIEQVLCLYQDLSPALLKDNPVGLGKLLDNVITMVTEDTADEDSMATSVGVETIALPQLYLLKLLAGTDARGLLWGKENKAGQSLMYQLLDMVTRLSQGSKLRVTSQQLICKLFESTGCFEGCIDELLIWMRCLQECVQTSDSSGTLLSFMSKVIMLYINNSYQYMERLGDILSSSQAVTDSANNAGAIASDTVIQNILDMDLENFHEEISDTNQSGKIRFPFCPALITAMETLQKMEPPDKGVQTFMSQTVLGILHRQIDPYPLCLCVISYPDNLLLPGIHGYTTSFISGRTVKMSSILASLEAVCSSGQYQLQQLYHGNKNIESFLESVVTMTTDDLDLVVRQCLLFIKSRMDQIDRVKDTNSTTRVQMLFTILLAVVKRQKELSLEIQESAEETAANISDEFSLLQIQPVSQKERLSLTVEVILSHPTIQDLFLSHLTGECTEQKSTAAVEITEFINSVLHLVYNCSLTVEGPLSLYRKRILSCLVSIKDSEGYKRYDTGSHKLILSLLSVILPQMDKKELSQSVESLVSGSEPEGLDTGLLVTWRSLLKDMLIQLTSKNKHQGVLRLSQECVSCLLGFTITCIDDPALLESVENLFETFPYLSLLCSHEVFMRMLKGLSSSSCRHVAKILVAHSLSVRHSLGKWMLIGEEMEADRLVYIPLVVEYLQHTSGQTSDPVVLAKVKKTYKSEFYSVCKDADDMTDCTDDLVRILQQIHRLGALDKKLVKKLEHKVTSYINETGKVTVQQVKIIRLVLGCLAPADNLTEDQPRRDRLLKVCIQGLAYSLSKKSHRNLELEETVLQLLAEFSQNEVEYLRVSWDKLTDIWPKFVKYSLKYLYTDVRMQHFLSVIVPVVYTNSSDVSITIDTLVDMVMSHSAFLPIIFNESHPETKECLVELLLQLFTLAPHCTKKEHIGIFLGSYGATLSQADQKILRLLEIYEKNGVKFSEYRPLLWGKKAIEHHTRKKSLGASLLKQPSVAQILENLDRNTMCKSIRLFPLMRKLQLDKVQNAADCKSADDCYDPCFLLPLFSQILSPDAIVNCRKFVDRDCLGYMLCALSSHEQGIRSAAYHVLDRYRVHLDAAKFPEQSQIQYLMDFLQNSLPKPTSKLACIISLFFVRAAKLMLHADDHMYKLINSFLLVKPSLDVLNIPEFYRLFNSHSLEYKTERGWILSLLVEGLRDTADYRIFEKRYTFKLLQSFYQSDLSDHQSQVMVLKVMRAASTERTVVMDMCENHGFLSWISGVITKLSPDDTQQLNLVVEILYHTWFTLLGNRELMKGTSLNGSEEKVYYVAPVHTSQMLTLLQTLVWYFREVKMQEYLSFLKTFASVLNHVQYTIKVLTEKSSRVVFPSLSQADITVVLMHAGRFLNSSLKDTVLLNCLVKLGYETKLLVKPLAMKHDQNQKQQNCELSMNHDVQNNVNEGEITHTSQVEVTQVFLDYRVGTKRQEVPKTKDIVDILVSIVTHWAPRQSHTSESVSDLVETTCAGVLTLCQWFVSQLHSIQSLKALSVLARWLEKNIAGGEAFSKLAAEALAKSQTLLCPVCDGLLEVCSKAVTLKASNDTEFDQYQQVLASLNSVLETIAVTKSAVCGTTWTDFLKKEKTSYTGLSDEQKSVLLRRFFLQTRQSSQSKSLSGRKRRGDKSSEETSTPKQKQFGKEVGSGKKKRKSVTVPTYPESGMDIQKENEKLPNGVSVKKAKKRHSHSSVKFEFETGTDTPTAVSSRKKKKKE